MVNPVLTKDVRQGLRTSVFAVLVHLSLGGALVAAILFSQGHNELEKGAELAFYLMMVLGVALLLGVPISAGARTVHEARAGTFDLASLAGARPWSLATGVFLASLLRSTLLVVLVAPFLTYVVVLGSPATDAFVLLAWIWLASCGLTAVAILCAQIAGRSGTGGYLLTLVTAAVLSLTVLAMADTSLSQLSARALQVGTLAPLALATLVTCLVVLRASADHLLPVGTRTFVRSRAAFLVGLPVVAAALYGVQAEHLYEDSVVPTLLALAVPPLLLATSVRRGHDPRVHAHTGPLWVLDTYAGALLMIAVVAGMLWAVDRHVAPLHRDDVIGSALLFEAGVLGTGLATAVQSLIDPDRQRPATYWAVLLAVFGGFAVLVTSVPAVLSDQAWSPAPHRVEDLHKVVPYVTLGAVLGLLGTLRFGWRARAC